jgi:hypothetical protein
MPCERVEQPLSRNALEDTSAPALMEIMMTGSPEDICLLACSPQSPGTRGSPKAAPSREGKPEPWGYVASPELPRARNGARAAGTRGGPGAAPSWEREPEPRGHVGVPRAAQSREQEPEPWGHVAAPELPSAGSESPSRGDTWRPRSCPELGVGARAAGTRGNLRAALSREAGAVVLT